VLGIFTDPLARGLPVGDGGRSAIEPELREAGFYSPNAVRDYAAIRAALVLIPLLATAVSANLLDKSNIPMIAVIGGAFAALGYSLPRIYVNYRGRLRKRQIERGLPIAVDLLALGLSGGQNILNTLERVAAELSPSFPILSSELLLVLKHAQLSSLPHALRQFADRVRIPEVNNLVLVLTQTERLGTDIFSGLVEFASHFRITQRQRADAHANRASFLMLFPTVFGLWVPAGVIFVAPMIYEFRHRSYDGVELAKKQDYRGAAKKNENARKTGATGAGEVRPKSGS
jgi:tight adherence protein C